MCIYFGNSAELTYKEQEHIFPAGIGGKRRLKKGMVSDKANALFSPMELELMRNSLISFERTMFGPGKRGSLDPKKASKSIINVGIKADKTPELCYTALGKPHGISQIHIHQSKAIMSIPNEKSDISKNKKEFIDALKKFNGKYKYIQSDNVAEGDLIIGYFEGVYYVSSKQKCTDRIINKEILKFLNYFQETDMSMGESHVRQTHRVIENENIAKIYAKIAMNVLAYIKGQKYAQHSNFDDIRNWIIGCDHKEEYFYLPSILTDELKFITDLVPEGSHWCIFIQNQDKIEVSVCLYNRYMRRFTFGVRPKDATFFPCGFICDWKSENEYTLMEYINKLSKENHERLGRKLE